MIAAALNATVATAIGFFSRRVDVPRPREIEVSLRAPPRPAAPPPPPVPPPPKPAAQPPKPAAPPKAIQPLVAPKEVPLKKLEEKDPVPVEQVAVGDGAVEAGAVATAPAAVAVAAPPPPPPPPPPKQSVPIDLPEEADPPEPLEDNAMPEYPEQARAQGLQGKVVLKLAISETGRVVGVTVLKGEEPFVSAATKVARTWRYEPARLDGQPFATFKIVVIPFELKG